MIDQVSATANLGYLGSIEDGSMSLVEGSDLTRVVLADVRDNFNIKWVLNSHVCL